MSAPFQNLDFEEYDPATWLVPGWTFQNDWTPPFGGSQVLTRLPLDYVGDPFSVSVPYATIFSGANKPFGFPADVGNYGLRLNPIITSQLYPWYVRQTGEIPADAKSMSFDIGGAQVSLKLNGIEVPLQLVSPPGTLAGRDFADVSAFAGQSATLEITAPGRLEDVLPFGAPGSPQPYTLLDNIRFSSAPAPPIIPEPGTLAFSIVGEVLAFLHWCLRKK